MLSYAAVKVVKSWIQAYKSVLVSIAMVKVACLNSATKGCY